MNTLREADIIRIMREEWDLKVRRLLESAQPGLKFDADSDGSDDELISPELKVLHNDSKVRYTVHSVGPDDVVLRTPEGEKILVDKTTLESDYVLD